MNKVPKRVSLANAFGTLGYLSTAFQWVWVLLLLAYPIINDESGFFAPSQQTTQSNPAIQFDPHLTPLLTFIAIAVTAVVLAITAITLVRMPKIIGKKAKLVGQSTARIVIPVVTHRRKVTQKERMRLSHRIILILKGLIVAAPLLLLAFVPPIDQLGSSTVWAIGLFAASCSLFYFITQQIIASIGKIFAAELW